MEVATPNTLQYKGEKKQDFWKWQMFNIDGWIFGITSVDKGNIIFM
jgi:hypothetical protein